MTIWLFSIPFTSDGTMIKRNRKSIDFTKISINGSERFRLMDLKSKNFD